MDLGLEVFYTMTENSGGLSVGTTLYGQQNRMSFLTAIFNPIMGHLSSCYVTKSSQHHLTVATQYDLNLYSRDADVSVGVEYSPPSMDQLIKARISPSEGIMVHYSGRLEHGMYSVGIGTTFGSATVKPKPIIGFELQI